MVKTRANDYTISVSNMENNSKALESEVDLDDSADSLISSNNIKLTKKEVKTKVLLYLKKIEKLRTDGAFILQSRTEEFPEYMNTIYDLYDFIIDNEALLIGNKKNSKFYKVTQERLYYMIRTIFKEFKRADLSYSIYNQYKNFFNLSYNKAFILDIDNDY